MYKVGDEVLVKAKIIEIGKDVPFPIRGKISATNLSLCFNEQELTPADKNYSQGLADAWELAKKILYGNDEQLIEIFGSCIDRIYFDLTCKREIINCYTPEEALAKIEAYEREKEIELGDVVVHDVDGRKTVFYVTYFGGGSIRGYDKECNKHMFTFPNRYIKKTGKHIDIESLLRQIGE